MRIWSWNVNGLRAVTNKGVLQEFLATQKPDILCLQETKIDPVALEKSSVRDIFSDYEQFYSFSVKKGYSGTAIWVRKSLGLKTTLISTDGWDFGTDEYGSAGNEGRITALDVGEFVLISVYVPNAKEDLSRLKLRQVWDEALAEFIKSLGKPVVVCGDFNVAHEEIDLANPRANRGKHGFTDEERADFGKLLSSADLVDTFRYFYPSLQDAYTWWSHWGQARAKNVGWRIDYFLVSVSLVAQIESSMILAEQMGSDHCPIEIEVA
jgi:exodeoxyribonuclease-3